MDEKLSGEQDPPEAVKQLAQKTTHWLYRRLAEGETIDETQVRAFVEADKTMRFDEVTDTYRMAVRLNEEHRAQLPKDMSDETAEKQLDLHENITFMLENAETEFFQEEGIT
jgi:hypothetical protein